MKFLILIFFSGGVDNLDKIICTYTVKRKTFRWPLNCFFYMIDVSAYNSFVLFNLKFKKEKNLTRQRGKSLEILANQLIVPYVELRKQKIAQNNFKHVKSGLIESIRKVAGLIKAPWAGTAVKKDGSCHLCLLDRVKAKRTTLCCIKCGNSKNHLNLICKNCEN